MYIILFYLDNKYMIILYLAYHILLNNLTSSKKGKLNSILNLVNI